MAPAVAVLSAPSRFQQKLRHWDRRVPLRHRARRSSGKPHFFQSASEFLLQVCLNDLDRPGASLDFLRRALLKRFVTIFFGYFRGEGFNDESSYAKGIW